MDFFSKGPGEADKNQQADTFVFEYPEANLKFELPIVDFSNPKMMDLVLLKDDADLGGLSEGQIGFCEKTKSLHAQGYINTERAPKMAEPPFFELSLGFRFPIKCRYANAFRIELSSINSNILALTASSVAMNSNMHSKNIGYLSVKDSDLGSPTLDNFISYDIPFENMVMEEMNMRKDRFFEHSLIPLTPREISIYCESLTETTFDFKIRKISAVFDPDILRINSVQEKAPFFVKKLEDYSLIDIADLSDNYSLKFKKE